jgi:hypothetical protein
VVPGLAAGKPVLIDQCRQQRRTLSWGGHPLLHADIIYIATELGSDGTGLGLDF